MAVRILGRWSNIDLGLNDNGVNEATGEHILFDEAIVETCIVDVFFSVSPQLVCMVSRWEFYHKGVSRSGYDG